MSKAIMQYIILVVVLLVICAGVAIFVILQKIEVEKKNEALQGQVSEYETKQQEMTKQVKDLTDQSNAVRASLEKKNQEADELKRKNSDVSSKLDKVSSEIDKVRRDKDDIESRMQTLRGERDELMKQVTESQNLRVERDKLADLVKELQNRPVPVVKPAEERSADQASDQSGGLAQQIGDQSTKKNEEYLARLEREKVALAMDLDSIKKELSETKLKITDLTKINSDMDVEIGRLKNEKDEISRHIKYGEDLADNLSIELARARNDQRMTAERASKVDADNQSLRSEIKQLTSTKVALEKSISRLTDDKAVVEKKLLETEGIIQSRIDEIWKIKKDIDTRFDVNSMKTGSAQVELPPIIVNANNASVPGAAAVSVPLFKRAGTIVSVNEDNNFIVVDIGEKSGIKVGDQLKVYRNGGQIGLVEVIQVRQDISAADIRQKSVVFKPGDTVK